MSFNRENWRNSWVSDRGLLSLHWLRFCFVGLVVWAAPAGAGVAEGEAAMAQGQFARALAAFAPLAKAGDAKAQYFMGYIFSRGLGVPADDKEALKWYRLAAAQGLAEAQFDIGSLYSEGRGVPRDDVEAFKWWLRAAEGGDQLAQSNVSNMYRDGVGTPQNLVDAYKWKVLSETRGASGRIDWGSIVFRPLARQMTPGQIAAGQREARKWLNSNRTAK